MMTVSRKMKSAALVVLQLVLTMDTCLGQSALNVSQLHDNLLTISPNVRPVHDLAQPTQINISFSLTSIISLDTVSQKLISNGWLLVSWKNDYMTWDPEDYEGIEAITPQSDQMWRPRVTVLNTMKELRPVGDDYIVMILNSSGVVMWSPAERFETFCRLDVTFFPFDIQHCTWELFIWGENGRDVDMQFPKPHIDLDSYQENGEWSLMTSRVWVEARYSDSNQFPVLIYEVTLRRRPTLLALTVLLPVFLLSFVDVYVFTIPSESGERLSYSVTSFLSFGVFMGFIVDLIPSSTKTVSIMAISLSCQLLKSSVYVLLCILSLRLFHRDSHRHPVSRTIQTLIVFLELLTCLDPPSKHPNQSTHMSMDVVSSEASGNFYGTEVKGSWLKGRMDKCARKRKAKQEAHTQPQDMTWQRVSRTLDKVLFRFFFCEVVVTNIVFIFIFAHNYTT